MKTFIKFNSVKNYKFFIDNVDDKHRFIFIDVGAMGGIPLKWSGMMGAMKVIAFEPDLREFYKLKSNDKIKYLNYVLHDKSEDLKYYITAGHGNSSIFKPNVDILSQYDDEERFQVIKESVISSTRVRNLDSIIEEDDLADIDFIKIDTQGSELNILKGAQKKVIPKILGIQIEVEFIEMYKNQPVFRDVDEFMDKNGLQLMDLRRFYWKRKDFCNYNGKGQLIFGDALYFKKLNVLFQGLSEINDKLYGRSKIFKSILTCLVYKMFDYAVSIANLGLRLKYFNKDECESVISEIQKYSAKGNFLDFCLNFKLYDMISLILKKVKSRSYSKWAHSDREIGNVKDI